MAPLLEPRRAAFDYCPKKCWEGYSRTEGKEREEKEDEEEEKKGLSSLRAKSLTLCTQRCKK